MTLDYGMVQKYNIERGFGFVKRTIQANTHRSDEVFFHISKIEERYPFAAYQLQGGYYYGISFWFETENTEKGERVSQVWLIADDIPNSQRDSLVAMVQSRWQDIDKPVPDWLEKVTCLLVGNRRLADLRQERECLLHEHQKAEAERKRLLEQEQRQAEAERLAKIEAEKKEREQAEAEREAQRRAEEAEAQARLAFAQQPVRPLIALQRIHPQRIDYWNGIYINSVRNCNIDFGYFQEQTGHGTRPLAPAGLVPYIAYYGGHHFYKLRAAFDATNFAQLGDRIIEIYDWGCGQAIATCILIDYLLEHNVHQHISQITLIEPSADALRAGYGYLHGVLMGHPELEHHIRCIQAGIGQVQGGQIRSHPDDLKIHLFSNILDVLQPDELRHIYNLIRQACPGENRFVCTGPSNYGANNINAFAGLFRNAHRLHLDYPDPGAAMQHEFYGDMYRANGRWEQGRITGYERQFAVML